MTLKKQGSDEEAGFERILAPELIMGGKAAVVNRELGGSESTVVLLPAPPPDPEDVSGRIRTVSASLDPWALPEMIADGSTPWKEMSHGERLGMVGKGVAKLVCLLALLYAFVCSLGILSQAFRLVGGRAAGEVFRDSQLLGNPICGLMIGVLATVLLQSSSTSTSIVVSMVSAQILTVRMAIPIVMGANIGTSMTNTLVSVAHSSKRAEFRRAFAGATVHDMFNWLCVLILLPLEVATGYLYWASHAIISAIGFTGGAAKPPKMLSRLTDPATNLIIQLDKSKIKAIALSGHNASISDEDDFTLIKRVCGKLPGDNGTMEPIFCSHLFAKWVVSDTVVGSLLLLGSLAVLISCLVLIVKLLNSMLKGKIAAAIRKTINNDFPHPFGFLTGYAAILLGMVMTILVQSSSVFTSALTPLVGIGVLSLERMYPLTLGANVGTTFTSVLAAMASPPERLDATLQIALCHFLFNLSGIALFYVVPATRKAPIALAKLLGEKTSKYRWVAVLYVAVSFFLLPAAIFGLSMAGTHVLIGVGVPFLSLLAAVTLLNVLQAQCPGCLPRCLQSWDFLPRWMHSLGPADRVLTSCLEGWRVGGLMCCSEADTSAGQASDPNVRESRKQLISLATSPAASAAASAYASRSASPSRRSRQRSEL